MAICSPYLLRPLRTFRQACRDISVSHPELIPPGIDIFFRSCREQCTIKNTPSLSKSEVIRQNRGDGKFTRPGRASRYDNLDFRNDVRSYPNGEGGIGGTPGEASRLTADMRRTAATLAALPIMRYVAADMLSGCQRSYTVSRRTRFRECSVGGQRISLTYREPAHPGAQFESIQPHPNRWPGQQD